MARPGSSRFSLTMPPEALMSQNFTLKEAQIIINAAHGKNSVSRRIKWKI